MIPSNLENKKKRVVAKDIEDKKGALPNVPILKNASMPAATRASNTIARKLERRFFTFANLIGHYPKSITRSWTHYRTLLQVDDEKYRTEGDNPTYMPSQEQMKRGTARGSLPAWRKLRLEDFL